MRANSVRFTLGTHFLHPVRRRTVCCFCFLPTSTFNPCLYHAVFSLKLLDLFCTYMTKRLLLLFLFSPLFHLRTETSIFQNIVFTFYIFELRRWTKSKLWAFFSQYVVTLIKNPLMDLVTVTTRHSE
jgi:hypothetical protein